MIPRRAKSPCPKAKFHTPLLTRLRYCSWILCDRLSEADAEELFSPLTPDDIGNLFDALHDIMNYYHKVFKAEMIRKYHAIQCGTLADLGYALGAIDVISNVRDLLESREEIRRVIDEHGHCNFTTRQDIENYRE
jgi:hypothetical protein